jgi:hypothetical protein
MRNREVSVVFGDTAAAKTLFVLRPRVFPPWDDPIRLAFGWQTGGGAAYAEFLRLTAEALRELAERLSTEVSELPSHLGRSPSSPPKLVDEYLWVRVTRELEPPSER